ncbi:XRE family transcriptional regulator [Pseudomonas aeruginosa]|nr:XRE family transcriptional regulator [Pseudomonas aeruginosa]MCS8829160.1 XRE family transcriptional regulator [Pseudomonas aeruginosa]MCS8874020.1 XRE family transcriptional regulator [Pseudomonas aeruginosa]MCS8907983.1 XRE family transcriptional regulator [Pseudomonas aeruginosa]MCS8914034.1 XRE family transcriptional regulator [Pseudomonas aeruginosa]
MIHDRIRRARLLRGMSLEALSQALGDITKQGLSKLEKGQIAPNSTRLLQLADALDVSPEYFFRPEPMALAPLEFRKLSKMPKYLQQQVEEQIREHLERYIALEMYFDPADIATRSTPFQQYEVNSIQEAEVAAEQLRVDWQIGSDAIANLTELLEENGIKVALLDGPDDFDGACAATEDNQHVLIGLNANRPGERMRFTAAHELGHWVMRLPEEMPEKEKEFCCHRFSGSFLYPKDRVKADFGAHQRTEVHPQELLIAKRQYGISMQAAMYRLKDLELLSADGHRNLAIQFSMRGWRKAEPEPQDCKPPQRFESLVYWGLAEGLFTNSRAAELLNRPVSALDRDLVATVETE